MREAVATLLPGTEVRVSQCDGGPIAIAWDGSDTYLVEKTAGGPRHSYRVYARSAPTRAALGMLSATQSTDGLEGARVAALLIELAEATAAAGAPLGGLAALTGPMHANLDPTLLATECQHDILDLVVRSGLRDVDAEATTCTRSVNAGKVSLSWKLEARGKSYAVTFDDGVSAQMVRYRIEQVGFPFEYITSMVDDRTKPTFYLDALTQLVDLMVAANGDGHFGEF